MPKIVFHLRKTRSLH